MITLDQIKEYENYIIEKRRQFHMYPETGFKEFKTTEYIKNELESFGIEIIDHGLQTGVVGVLKGSPGKTVLLRADIDALNMQEELEVPYKSKHDGIMHSCGHDTHAAMLLGAAKYLSNHKELIKGTIKFVFQPAEEGPMPGGGKLLVENGMLNDVDAVFGLHITTKFKNKTISVKKGPAMAAPDEFKIIVNGVGTHASAPHTGVDPIYVASEIITNLQSITSRNVNPVDSAVISVCTINGGTAFNIIPETVEMSGTIRTLTPQVREYTFKRLNEIVNGISTLHGANCEVEIIPAYPPLINHKKESNFVLDIAKKTIPVNDVFELDVPSMGGEDFSYFLQEKPGCYFWLGAGHTDTDPYNHNPYFNPDEDSFIVGTLMHINTAIEYLKQDQ